jgi:hypothetical protein
MVRLQSVQIVNPKAVPVFAKGMLIHHYSYMTINFRLFCIAYPVNKIRKIV